MILTLLAAAAASAASSSGWSFEDDVFDGERACAISQTYDDGTAVTILVSDDTIKHEQFAFFAANPAWSIEGGERLGDITVSAPDYNFGSEATGGDGGQFFIGAGMVALDPFLKSAGKGGFTITRTSKRDIGSYSAAGLEARVAELQQCIKRRFPQASSDPFAD